MSNHFDMAFFFKWDTVILFLRTFELTIFSQRKSNKIVQSKLGDLKQKPNK